MANYSADILKAERNWGEVFKIPIAVLAGWLGGILSKQSCLSEMEVNLKLSMTSKAEGILWEIFQGILH